MNNYYPPVLRCEIVHAMVRIDRTMHECAVENHCKPGCHCPLSGHFQPESALNQPIAGWLNTRH